MKTKENLMEKIHKELDEFRSNMLLRSKEEIYSNAYEIAIRGEIVCLLETTYCISDEQATAIYCLADSLGFFYYIWMNWAGDSLRDAIDFALAEEWKHILVTEN